MTITKSNPYLSSLTHNISTSSPTTPMTPHTIIMALLTTLSVVAVTSVVSFFLSVANPALGSLLVLGVGCGGLAVALVAAWKKLYDSPGTTLLYALMEGLCVGAFSHLMTLKSPQAGSFIMQALIATMAVAFVMMFVYTSRIIRVTATFTKILLIATASIVVVSLMHVVLYMLGIDTGLRSGGMIGIAFSLICIVVAALGLLVDFDTAENLMQHRAGRKYSWGVAMSISISLVWLYIEILRLIVTLNRN